MQLPEPWLEGIRAWAEANSSVREVWPFAPKKLMVSPIIGSPSMNAQN